MQASAFFNSRSSQQPDVVVGQHQSTPVCGHEQSTATPSVTSTKLATTGHIHRYQQQPLSTWSGYIRFPASRAYLWDRTMQGAPVYVQPCLSYVEVASSVLQAAVATMQGSHANQAQLQLRGQLSVDAAGQQQCRMQLVPGRTSQLPGTDELVVPCRIQRQQQHPQEQAHQPDAVALKGSLSAALNARGPAHLGMLFASACEMLLRQDGSAQLTGSLLMPGSPLSFGKLGTKRVVDVPLAKQLSAAADSADVLPSDGFLTMDAARSLVPLAATDAQVYSVPLVGVWVRGVAGPQHPAVQAACLRFAYSSTLPDKACQGPGAFLLLLYPSGGCMVPECHEARVHDEQGKMALLQFRYRGELLQLRGTALAQGAPQQRVGGFVRLDLHLDETVPQACLLSPSRSQGAAEGSAGTGSAGSSTLLPYSANKAVQRPGTAPSTASAVSPGVEITVASSTRPASVGPAPTGLGSDTLRQVPQQQAYCGVYKQHMTSADSKHTAAHSSQQQACLSRAPVQSTHPALPQGDAADVWASLGEDVRQQHESSPPPEPRHLAPPQPVTPSSELAQPAIAHTGNATGWRPQYGLPPSHQVGPAQNGKGGSQSLDLWLQQRQQQQQGQQKQDVLTQQQQQTGVPTQDGAGAAVQTRRRQNFHDNQHSTPNMPPLMAAGSKTVTAAAATASTSNGNVAEVSSAAMVNAAIASVDMLLEPVRSSVASVDLVPEPVKTVSPDHMPGAATSQQPSGLNFRYPSLMSSISLKPLYNPLKRGSIADSMPPSAVNHSYADVNSSQQGWHRHQPPVTPYLPRGPTETLRGPLQYSAMSVPATPHSFQAAVHTGGQGGLYHDAQRQQNGVHGQVVHASMLQQQQPRDAPAVAFRGHTRQPLFPHQPAGLQPPVTQPTVMATTQQQPHACALQQSSMPMYRGSAMPHVAGPPAAAAPGLPTDTQTLQQQVLLLQQQVSLLQTQLQLLAAQPSTQSVLLHDGVAANAHPIPPAPPSNPQQQSQAQPQGPQQQQSQPQPRQPAPQATEQQQFLQGDMASRPGGPSCQHNAVGSIGSIGSVQHVDSSVPGMPHQLLVQQPSSNESSPQTGASTLKTAGCSTSRSQPASARAGQGEGLQSELSTPCDDDRQGGAVATPAAASCPGSTRSAGLAASKRELFGSDCCSTASSCQSTPCSTADQHGSQHGSAGTSNGPQQVAEEMHVKHQPGDPSHGPVAAAAVLLRPQSPRANSPARSFPQHPLLSQLMRAASDSSSHASSDVPRQHGVTDAAINAGIEREAAQDAGSIQQPQQDLSGAQSASTEASGSCSPDASAPHGHKVHAYSHSSLYSSSTSTALRASASDVIRTRYIPLDDDDDSDSSDSELEEQLMRKFAIY